MSPSNLYQILGVQKSSTAAEIKKAYRKLARANHPDRNPDDPKAEDRFKKISAAFDVLGDTQKRKLYDEFGEEATHSGFDPEQARTYREAQEQARAYAQRRYRTRGGGRGPGGVDLEDLLRGERSQGGFSFSDLGGAISDLFGGAEPKAAAPGDHAHRRAPRPPNKGADIETEIAISFRKAVLGGKTRIRVGRSDRHDEQRLTVTIPVGLRDGQKIRLAGQGLSGPVGGKAGDLLITVKVRTDPFFRRDGDDLQLTLPVSVGEAIRGATIEVPTLQTPVRLKIPPGSQTGKRLRLKGKGVPTHQSKQAGHLYVELEVVVPQVQTLDPKLDEAIDRIERAYQNKPRRKLRREASKSSGRKKT